MKKQTKIAFSIFFAACFSLLYPLISKGQTAKALAVASTGAGTVSGLRNSAGDVAAFKGVPFAAPPVGDLRWKAPQPVAHWAGVKKCDAFGPSPMQPKPVPFMVYTSEFLIPEKPISEDCLYLNIWTNATIKTAKKPVYMWIYGGGFTSGGSACPIYDGEAMAKKGIVFVSVNYRVGVFGFLAHPELTKESPERASGNYGLLDQIAALKWIKKNIAAFGGDPDNVTIGGQSAGSMSVNCLVASPLAKGLFKRAIAESGSLMIKNPMLASGSLISAQQQGESAAEKAGATSLAQMRAMPAEDVLKKFQGRYAPITDGYVLLEPVADVFEKGDQNHVPLLTGWNADEAFVTNFKNAQDFKRQAREQYGKDADEFLKYFPAGTDDEAKDAQIEVSRDMIFALSGYKWAGIQSKDASGTVYVYNFNRRVPAEGKMVQFRAFHTAEVPYVMDDLKFLKRPLQPSDHALAKLMSAYWVNFIKTGNPNGKGLPAWPKYDTGQNLVKLFDVQSTTAKLPGKGGLDFLLARAK